MVGGAQLLHRAPTRAVEPRALAGLPQEPARLEQLRARQQATDPGLNRAVEPATLPEIGDGTRKQLRPALALAAIAVEPFPLIARFSASRRPRQLAEVGVVRQLARLRRGAFAELLL